MVTVTQIANLEPSSGSFRALQIAHNYPDSVGRFVLDAVVPHAVVRFFRSKFKPVLKADLFPRAAKSKLKIS